MITTEATHHIGLLTKVVLRFPSVRNSVQFILVILYSLFLIPYSNAQEFTLQSKVIESETGTPIPYASVYTLKDRKGTITRIDGTFELTKISENDTIVFYFAGFQKKKVLAKHIGATVSLSPLEQLLDDVIVMADASIPYKLIAGTRKSIINGKETAQSYLEMQSFLDDKQLEYFQGYYNGTYDGYDIDVLELKTARFGIQKTPNLAFLSQETSKAMYKQELFSDNDFFPDSPFGLKSRKLVKSFKVILNAKYKEQNGDITYVVSFAPRDDTSAAFAGKAWIDSATNILTKVEFSIENASRFPFVPLHKGGELENVNMHIRKSYEKTERGVQLTSMDFDYDFVFDPKGFYNVNDGVVYKQIPNDSGNYEALPTFHIRSEAILAAYDYDKQFFIPRFDFPDPEFGDYRRMIALKDHSDFWDCYTDFRVGKSESKEQFLDDPRTVTHKSMFRKSALSDMGAYEYPYRHWSKKRIYLRTPAEPETTTPHYNAAFEGNSINAQKYHLVAQILFETDSLCGTWNYRTRTVYDPFQSYFHFEQTPRSVAFLNVYFDLMELSRRELNAKLDAVENPNAHIWTTIYEEHMAQNQEKMAVFFKEVERGTSEEEFLKWNEIVCDELGIDNNALFSIPEEDESE